MLVLLVIVLQWTFLCGEKTTSEDVITLVTEATLACNANDTACNISSSTTAVPPNSSLPFDRDVHLKVYQQDVDTCTCDLHKNFCDVNCCCDKDCSFNDKRVFTSCSQESNINRDTSFCRYVDYIYLNNTPYEWEVNRNGLFCIVKTNLPPKYTLQSYKTISTFEDSQTQKRDRHVWPETEIDQLVPQLVNESYIHGSNIWILRNHTLEAFELSKSFITEVCLTKERVNYLNNFNSHCSVIGVDADNMQLQAMTYYGNISFIRDPQLLNASATEIWNCPKNACLSVSVKYCSEENCTILNSSKPVVCEINHKTYEKTCFNLVYKVLYNFYHNGTWGLTHVELLLTLKNVSYFLHDQDYEFQQKFEVRFFWPNATLNYSQSLSGNPGYIIGKPLVIGNLDNGTVSRDPKLIYDNFLVFPVSKKGVCALSNALHVLSEFRYNMILKCRVQREMTIKENSSASDLCREAQRAIFAFWPISVNSSVEKVVGAFGNANESIEADWIKILLSNSSDLILNGSLGNFTNDNRTIICHNLITTLKVDVFHAQIDLQKLLRQEKIVAVAYDFGRGQKHAFTVTDKMYLDAMVREQVTYFDVTTERVEKYAQPPAFKINLPYDFFYPFVKVGNSAHALRFCYLVKLFMYFNVASLIVCTAF